LAVWHFGALPPQREFRYENMFQHPRRAVQNCSLFESIGGDEDL
jgi:hypothetical protein